MAKHEIERDGIIYTFPDDDSFQKYKQGLAILDRRGRLVHSKTKILIKILEHRVAPKQSSSPTKPVFSPAQNVNRTIIQEVSDGAKGFTRELISEISTEGAKGLSKWFVHKAVPYIFYEKIVPTYKKFKAHFEDDQHSLNKVLEEHKNTKSAFSKQLKVQHTNESQSKPLKSASVISSKSDFHNQAVEQKYTEQQLIVFHFIVQFKSLAQRYNDGEMDLSDSLKQITEKTVIAQFNQAIESDPNIIGMTKYNELAKILGRDLFQNGKYVPIKAIEIKKLFSFTKQEEY